MPQAMIGAFVAFASCNYAMEAPSSYRVDAQGFPEHLIGKVMGRALSAPRLDCTTLEDTVLGKCGRKDSSKAPASPKPVPIYKNFEEFLACPFGKRCVTPVSPVEFSFIQTLLDEPDHIFKQTIKRPGVNVQHRTVAHSKIVLTRGFMDFADLDPDVILYKMLDFKSRLEWDKLLRTIEYVEEAGPNSDIIYCEVPAPVIRDRDLVLEQSVHVEKSGSGQDYIVITRSRKHKRKPIDLQRKIVRMKSHMGGLVIRRKPDGKTELCIVQMADPCGIVPKWLVNLFASQKLYEFMYALRQASIMAQKSASDDPSLRSQISKFTARFQRTES